MATEEPEEVTIWVDGPSEPPDFAFVRLSPAPPLRWRLGLGLLAFSVLGTALVMPFSIALILQTKNNNITPNMIPFIWVVSLVLEGGISAAAIALGLAMGRRAGLGPFLLDGFDGPTTQVGWVGASKALAISTVLGTILALGIVGLSHIPWMAIEDSSGIKMPSPFVSLLGSIGAGIREEVWLRLGFMTFLAWLGAIITRRKEANAPLIWTANVLAALLFGAMHLPQASSLLGLNAAVVTFVMVGNGIPGIVFGWLYWRKGLVAAMVSHTVFDIVMKVILPALLN